MPPPTEHLVELQQLEWHSPPLHASLSPLQVLPQLRQLRGSVSRSTHAPPHAESPGRHRQLPETQS
jgi:hypothetical protein